MPNDEKLPEAQLSHEDKVARGNRREAARVRRREDARRRLEAELTAMEELEASNDVDPVDLPEWSFLAGGPTAGAKYRPRAEAMGGAGKNK